MKLAAIYNIFDGAELLRGSINTIKDHVDVIIIVYQTVSNFGEEYNPIPDMDLDGIDCVLWPYTPTQMGGAYNEMKKRNIGLAVAKQMQCTHFLQMDCDEYYKDFEAAKLDYIASGADGSVCSIYCYFNRPTWRFKNPDGYYVPFIHKLWPETASGNCKYPFYVDPTRRINSNNVVLLAHYMHHFSWVRREIERKARNSSAGNLLKNTIIFEDYHSKELESNPEGFLVRNFNQQITVVEDYFGINTIHHRSNR